MSALSKSSLDNEWELATTRTSSSRDQTISSDDDVDDEELSLVAEEVEESELGDEWEGVDDTESQSESLLSPIEQVQTTPLQAQRLLSAGAADDLSASIESTNEPSENSGTDSTFSFHFPDPLEASREYYAETTSAVLPPVLDGELSDVETNSNMESDPIGLGMSIGALERSATLVVVPSGRSAGNHRSPVVSSSILRTPRFPFTARLVLIAAFLIACLALPGVYHVILPRSQVPVVVPTSPTSSYDLGESLALVTPLPVVPLVEEPVFIVPDPSEAISTTESSLSPVPSASSRGSTSAIASTYFSFSNMVLRDLHDVMRVIDEILAFLRNQTLADAKRTMLEYWAYVLADRHKRAKSNARKLWSRARRGVV